MLERIKMCFTESIQTQIAAAELLPEAIHLAAVTIVQGMLNGNKVLCCGNGGSAASAQYFHSILTHHVGAERPSLPVVDLTSGSITLTAVINAGLSGEIYAKQVRAIGQPGDILLVFSALDSTEAVIKAVEAAVTRDMTIIALTGHNGAEIAGLLGDHDVEIRVPSACSSRIQEVHTLTIHCLFDLIEVLLFKSQ